MYELPLHWIGLYVAIAGYLFYVALTGHHRP